jgi:glucose-1-phosphate cytidylyltransferase
MKVVVLAGGFGTRLAEYTDLIPKPMTPIGEKPIIWHIMNHYAHYGHKDFYLALGYKAEVIKDYFLNYRSLNSDFSINTLSGEMKEYNINPIDWNVSLINTGLNTMTGGRLKRLKDFIGNETFMLTYGDGVANVDIDRLISFHRSHGKMITMTAVRPSARFGELNIKNDFVVSFQEKPQLHDGWINGGFFVIEPNFLDLIEGDHTLLELEPLVEAVRQGQLMSYRHNGFWHCMDSKRDHETLEAMWNNGNPPWIVK